MDEHPRGRPGRPPPDLDAICGRVDRLDDDLAALQRVADRHPHDRLVGNAADPVLLPTPPPAPLRPVPPARPALFAVACVVLLAVLFAVALLRGSC